MEEVKTPPTTEAEEELNDGKEEGHDGIESEQGVDSYQ